MQTFSSKYNHLVSQRPVDIQNKTLFPSTLLYRFYFLSVVQIRNLSVIIICYSSAIHIKPDTSSWWLHNQHIADSPPTTFTLALTALYLSYLNSLLMGLPVWGLFQYGWSVIFPKLVNHIPVQIPFKNLTISTLMLLQHPPSIHTVRSHPLSKFSSFSTTCQTSPDSHYPLCLKYFPHLHSSMSNVSVVASPLLLWHLAYYSITCTVIYCNRSLTLTLLD